MNKGTSEERMCKEKSPVAQPAGAAVPWELLLFPQKQEPVDWADLAPEIPMIAISLEAVSISPMLSLLRIVVVQSLSRVQPFAIPWTATCQASRSSTMSWSLLKFMSLSWWCHLSLLQSIFPTIGVFSSELSIRTVLCLCLSRKCSKSWGFRHLHHVSWYILSPDPASHLRLSNLCVPSWAS